SGFLSSLFSSISSLTSFLDLSNILLHESWHIKNHDIWIKQFINILVILYWWFIPIYRLQQNIDLFLEMRVDNQVTQNFSEQDTLNYMKTLVSIQEKLTQEEKQAIYFSINDNSKILSYRINYIMNGMFKKNTNTFLLIILIFIPFLSNLIILESHFDIPKEEGIYEQTDINKGYIVEYSDGSYELILDGQCIKIQNPNDDVFKDVPIIKESGENK
ncbi:MAG: M56 family metallopeptidase, partial [Bacillota bacterium]|nr:M56 family metallopeptidase [Bacillota bacterium]